MVYSGTVVVTVNNAPLPAEVVREGGCLKMKTFTFEQRESRRRSSRGDAAGSDIGDERSGAAGSAGSDGGSSDEEDDDSMDDLVRAVTVYVRRDDDVHTGDVTGFFNSPRREEAVESVTADVDIVDNRKTVPWLRLPRDILLRTFAAWQGPSATSAACVDVCQAPEDLKGHVEAHPRELFLCYGSGYTVCSNDVGGGGGSDERRTTTSTTASRSGGGGRSSNPQVASPVLLLTNSRGSEKRAVQSVDRYNPSVLNATSAHAPPAKRSRPTPAVSRAGSSGTGAAARAGNAGGGGGGSSRKRGGAGIASSTSPRDSFEEDSGTTDLVEQLRSAKETIKELERTIARHEQMATGAAGGGGALPTPRASNAGTRGATVSNTAPVPNKGDGGDSEAESEGGESVNEGPFVYEHLLITDDIAASGRRLVRVRDPLVPQTMLHWLACCQRRNVCTVPDLHVCCNTTMLCTVWPTLLACNYLLPTATDTPPS
jgi:hypothetical protein